MATKSPLVNVAQAAEILRISPRAVRRRILAGTIPAQKLGPGTSGYVLLRADVEALAAKDAAA